MIEDLNKIVLFSKYQKGDVSLHHLMRVNRNLMSKQIEIMHAPPSKSIKLCLDRKLQYHTLAECHSRSLPNKTKEVLGLEPPMEGNNHQLVMQNGAIHDKKTQLPKDTIMIGNNMLLHKEIACHHQEVS